MSILAHVRPGQLSKLVDQAVQGEAGDEDALQSSSHLHPGELEALGQPVDDLVPQDVARQIAPGVAREVGVEGEELAEGRPRLIPYVASLSKRFTARVEPRVSDDHRGG